MTTSSDMLSAMKVSAMGMKVQGARIRLISENIANADTTGDAPGKSPYRRQTISFKNELDRDLGFNMVKVNSIDQDTKTPFGVEYNPDHPAADEKGYVQTPNVNMMIEIMDAKEAQRSYQANLGMIEQSRAMLLRTVDLLRV
jgi:flagellar basal-body rod protein FlgC